MSRELKMIAAGSAFDRIRGAREATLMRAQELFDEELGKLPRREQAIRARVPPEELALLDSMLAAIAPKHDEPEAFAEANAIAGDEPIRLVGKPRGG